MIEKLRKQLAAAELENKNLAAKVNGLKQDILTNENNH